MESGSTVGPVIMERIIFHLDMDSYFASVEQQANPKLRERPIVVTGKPTITSVVAASSREAKEYGIKSAMNTWEARKLYPDVLLIPGDPEKYDWLSGQFLSILKDYSPRLEAFGIDEAFMDLTDRIDPDTDPTKVAYRVKREIQEALGKCITCSIGIAKNKLLAKLASDLDKPDGVTLIRDNEIPDLLRYTPLTDLCGIGSRIKQRLTLLGIENLHDLGKCPESKLRKEFGMIGARLKLMGQGKDPSPVLPVWHKEPIRSVGNSLTLPKSRRNPKKAMPVLFRLCQQVARRLRQKGLLGRTVKLMVRDEDFVTDGKQLTLGQETDDGNRIYSVCQEIRKEMDFPQVLTLIGVRVSNLTKKNQLSQPLFSDQRKKEKLLSTIDSINQEFGDRTLYFAYQFKARDLLPSVGEFRSPRGFR